MFSLAYLIPQFDIYSASWNEADAQAFSAFDGRSWAGIYYWSESHAAHENRCHHMTWGN